MTYPPTFAATFNALKERAEERMLLKYGSADNCEKIVRELLVRLSRECDNQDVDAVFLAAGQIVASIINAQR